VAGCDADLPDLDHGGDAVDAQHSLAELPNTPPVSPDYFEVPATPMQLPATNLLRFFTPQEALTVEALTARIFPGDTSDPGAREAGVMTYIDNLLATNHGFPDPVFLQPPYLSSTAATRPRPTAPASRRFGSPPRRSSATATNRRSRRGTSTGPASMPSIATRTPSTGNPSPT